MKNKEDSSFTYWILLFCIIICTACIRMRLLSTPFERDEGEYAYIGQLLLQGIPPYQDAFTMKLPGTSMIYALFMLLFGQTTTAIHLGLLLVNVVSIVLLFLLTKKWLSPGASLVAAVSFAVTALNFDLFGFAAHATHFVMLFALGGLFALMHALERKRPYVFFISGILFGLAFLMKQPGICFFFLGLSILLLTRWRGRLVQREFFRFSLFLAGGFILPCLAVLSIILVSGTFDKFWFWTIQYTFQYGTAVSFYESAVNLINNLDTIWKALPLFCILTATGFMFVVLRKVHTPSTAFLLLFGAFSFLALVPGGNFRLHYFILILPVCSALSGFGFQVIQTTIRGRAGWKYLPAVILMVIVVQNIYANRIYYFTETPRDIVERCYRENHFAESIPIANFLAAHTTPDDRIAILGSEPQIYFYAKRRSASSHIYMYGMMEEQPYARRMQEEFIADVEHTHPKYIIYYRVYYSWLPQKNSDLHLLQWRKGYLNTHCHLTGVVDLVNVYDVRYIWGTDAATYTPVSQYAIFIYERTDNKQ